MRKQESKSHQMQKQESQKQERQTQERRKQERQGKRGTRKRGKSNRGKSKRGKSKRGNSRKGESKICYSQVVGPERKERAEFNSSCLFCTIQIYIVNCNFTPCYHGARQICDAYSKDIQTSQLGINIYIYIYI